MSRRLRRQRQEEYRSREQGVPPTGEPATPVSQSEGATPQPLGPGQFGGSVGRPKRKEESLPNALELPSAEFEDRLRSYVRHGQCPSGLPQRTMLRCLELLGKSEAKKREPSSLAVQRVRNVKQRLRLDIQSGEARRIQEQLERKPVRRRW